MLNEWKITRQELEPWVLQEDYSNFNTIMEKFEYGY